MIERIRLWFKNFVVKHQLARDVILAGVAALVGGLLTEYFDQPPSFSAIIWMVLRGSIGKLSENWKIPGASEAPAEGDSE